MKVEASVRRMHDGLAEVAEVLQPEVRELLEDTAKASGWHFSDRVKKLESFALKLALGREVDDFYACSLIVPNLTQAQQAIELVEGCFAVIARRPKEPIRSRPTQFDFDSPRLYCKLKPSVDPAPRHGMLFEVQVKTLLAEAWSKATHDFSYKSGEISWARERLAAQLKAILDNVELSVAEAETLSRSPGIDRAHESYIARSKVLTWLRDDLGSRSDVLLPFDLRRLAEAVFRLLGFMEAGLDDLRGWIDAEEAAGRGFALRDLSPYAIILQSAMSQKPAAFHRRARSNEKLFLPPEVAESFDANLTEKSCFISPNQTSR